MNINWEKVAQAMIDKGEDYLQKAAAVEASSPGLAAEHRKRAFELCENAEFLLAGLE